MSYGVVMFKRRDMPESRIWEMAMGRGQFIAIYTARRMEGIGDSSGHGLWSSALVPPTEEPLTFPPFADPAGHHADYARYEPEYDEQFLQMCQQCTGSPTPTIVLPAIAGDEEAMRLLGELDSIQSDAWRYMYERFYVVPRHNLRKAQKSEIRLSHLLRPIRPRHGWAYFLGFFRSGDGVVVFLSDNESDVQDLFQPRDADGPVMRQADWLHNYGVIDKW